MSTTTTEPKTSEKAAPPVARLRVGLISASIWQRNTEKGRFYSVTFERRYRSKEGAWHTSHAHDEGDVLALAKAADLAHTRLLELRAADSDPDDGG